MKPRTRTDVHIMVDRYEDVQLELRAHPNLKIYLLTLWADENRWTISAPLPTLGALFGTIVDLLNRENVDPDDPGPVPGGP